MPNPTIYYIRHGQTDWNAEFRFQGRQDIPLNAKGRVQADENGRKLKLLIGRAHGFRFIASPLSRARETMERVREAIGLPREGYETDERLTEICYGELEGTTLTSLKVNNNPLHRYRKANAWHFQPANGESHEMVSGRVFQWCKLLKEDCVVAAHGAIGRVLRYHLLDLNQQEAARFSFPQDKICVIRRGEEKFI